MKLNPQDPFELTPRQRALFAPVGTPRAQRYFPADEDRDTVADTYEVVRGMVPQQALERCRRAE